MIIIQLGEKKQHILMNIPPGFWDNSQCEALSAMKCGRKKPDFAEYQEIRADKSHQEEDNNGKKL